mmetsp:Transcript_53595/g.79654  ORF Transcript_53595/g.79654 Transcript_53595/m.79654 type:complete len:169 (-) Transcript_53595:52-558(-)
MTGTTSATISSPVVTSGTTDTCRKPRWRNQSKKNNLNNDSKNNSENNLKNNSKNKSKNNSKKGLNNKRYKKRHESNKQCKQLDEKQSDEIVSSSIMSNECISLPLSQSHGWDSTSSLSSMSSVPSCDESCTNKSPDCCILSGSDCDTATTVSMSHSNSDISNEKKEKE